MINLKDINAFWFDIVRISKYNRVAGPINWFLSWKMWKFIARISYAMYLFHYPIQFVMHGADIMPNYFTFENMVSIEIN